MLPSNEINNKTATLLGGIGLLVGGIVFKVTSLPILATCTITAGGIGMSYLSYQGIIYIRGRSRQNKRRLMKKMKAISEIQASLKILEEQSVELQTLGEVIATQMHGLKEPLTEVSCLQRLNESAALHQEQSERIPPPSTNLIAYEYYLEAQKSANAALIQNMENMARSLEEQSIKQQYKNVSSKQLNS